MKTVITRKEYMENKYSFNEYYGQFCTTSIKNFVKNAVGINRIRESTDPHFNDIPLVIWDRLKPSIISMVGQKLSEANGSGGISLSDCVCVAKTAAKLIKSSK